MLKKIFTLAIAIIASNNSHADYIPIVDNGFQPESEIEVVGTIEAGCGPTTGTGCYIITTSSGTSYYLSRMRENPDLSNLLGKIVKVYGQSSTDKMHEFRLFNKNFNLYLKP